MSNCQNCKATLSCGCQRRIASDGTAVCANCISAYEAPLLNAPQVKPTTEILYVNASLNKTT